MKYKFLNIIFVCFVLFVITNGSITGYVQSAPFTKNHQKITFFYSATCKKCLEVKDFLSKISNRYPEIKIQKYNLTDVNNIGLMNEYYNAYQVPYEDWNGNWALFIGNKCYTKFQLLQSELEAEILELKHRQVKQFFSTGQRNLQSIFKSFNMISIITAGFIDGINPCAFATMIFLISYLFFTGKKGKEIFCIGSAFILGVYFAYLGIGLGIFKALRTIEYLHIISRVLYFTIGFLALSMAVFSFTDYKKAKRRQISEMTLQLPRPIKNLIHKIIRIQTQHNYLVLFAFCGGIIISVLELMCTGQIYLPTIMYILSVPELKIKAFYYLNMYTLAFISPLIIITFFAVFGTSSEKLACFCRQHVAILKLLTCFVFLMLAVYMFLIAIERFFGY
ncbi:MAG: hypothetical protein ABH952_07510 [Candidatus Omnitrophota bacterium]